AAALIHQLYQDMGSLLADELRARGFLGPIGIDAFVYLGHDGFLRLKPIVEINPRYTMGRVTLELMRYTAPGSYGRFRLVNPKQAHSRTGFAAYAQALVRSQPLCVRGQPVPKIVQGAICLNDPGRAQQCLAVFEVRSRVPLSQGRPDPLKEFM